MLVVFLALTVALAQEEPLLDAVPLGIAVPVPVVEPVEPPAQAEPPAPDLPVEAAQAPPPAATAPTLQIAPLELDAMPVRPLELAPVEVVGAEPLPVAPEAPVESPQPVEEVVQVAPESSPEPEQIVPEPVAPAPVAPAPLRGERVATVAPVLSPAEPRPQERALGAVGVGVKVGRDPDVGWVVQGVVEGGPAHEAGIWPGDVVRAVDGLPIDTIDGKGLRPLVLGAPGTRTVLAVERDGVVDDLPLVRAGTDEEAATIGYGCVLGSCEEGLGVWVFEDRSRYEGDWAEGMRQGKGSYIWPDGERCDGTWQADQGVGNFACVSQDGEAYEGTLFDWVEPEDVVEPEPEPVSSAADERLDAYAAAFVDEGWRESRRVARIAPSEGDAAWTTTWNLQGGQAYRWVVAVEGLGWETVVVDWSQPDGMRWFREVCALQDEGCDVGAFWAPIDGTYRVTVWLGDGQEVRASQALFRK